MGQRKILKAIGLFAAVIAMAAFWPLPSSGFSEPIRTDVFIGGQGSLTFRIPALVVSARGTLLAFGERRLTGIFDHGNIDLALKRSFDRGATWGPLQVIEGQGFQTWGNPAPILDRDTGVIWLAFCLNNQRVFITSSRDDGATWAPPREITPDVKLPGWTWYATGPGHGLQLSSGRLLIPCDHLDQAMSSHVIYSDDHGQTWKLGGSLDPGTDEALAVETADGGVYLSMRNTYGEKRRAFARSEDGGLSWSPVQLDPALVDPTCQASVIRLTSEKANGRNRILFVNPASEQRRNLAIRLSYDEAETWSEPRTIHAGPAAYSDLAILPDLTVGVLYENGKHWPYRKITFARIGLDWISRGQDNLEGF